LQREREIGIYPTSLEAVPQAFSPSLSVRYIPTYTLCSTEALEALFFQLKKKKEVDPIMQQQHLSSAPGISYRIRQLGTAAFQRRSVSVERPSVKRACRFDTCVSSFSTFRNCFQPQNKETDFPSIMDCCCRC
jgi:hypothetical protein